MSSPLASFGRDRRGSVLVEFAFVLPLMITLFFGVVEGTRAVRVKMNLANAAAAYANMIAMQSSQTASQMSNSCNGAKLSMYPFSSTPFIAAAASVTKSQSAGTVAVDWNDTTHCGAATAIASATTVATSPTNMIPNNGDSVIIVRATYTYTAPFHVIFPSTMSFTVTVFARPRNNSSVTCTACT